MPKIEYINTIISDSPSLGLHESQSRFWENMIARNIHFWKYFYPIFEEISPDSVKNIDIDTLYRYINQVKPSLIRVEADELTYSLHIILRFELETLMIEDEIKISELPETWNGMMKELLDVSPENDKEGVLQDMHWSSGSIGYFPTYAIGSIYSAQIFNRLVCKNPDVFREIENADFGNILEWLRENIHKFGRRFSADDIIKNCCGEGLNSRIFVEYLKDKYYNLYDI
jgi:carboxypeptidase Taq